MKTSLRRLRGLAHHKHGGEAKQRPDVLALPQLDELAQASQDMQDMRDCYEGLLYAAAATTNCAYEFSDSLREMGTCLLAKTALNDDEESAANNFRNGWLKICCICSWAGKGLLMLGKVQFKLQKLLDSYRSHISQTITIPSESLLNELRTVEEMKRQCEEKRNVYEHMAMRYKEKGRSKGRKGDNFSMQQLQVAHDEYDDEATLFVFRLKSLKQGQSRSLLTQAARHHAAQLNFFRKALKSLEEIEPHVQKLDQVGLTFPQVAILEASKENLERSNRHSFSFRGEIRNSSQSAPLFVENKSESSEKIQPLPSRKSSSYVLPTPVATKGSIGLGKPAPQSYETIWHSSPLELHKYQRLLRDEKISGSAVINAQAVLRESNKPASSTQLPPPLADKVLLSRVSPAAASDSKKIKRQAFSGPLTSKQWPSKPVSVEHPQLFSGPILRNPMSQLQAASPKVSPNASPPFVSSPKISELHELPRPPATSASKSSRPLGLVGYSGPLMPRGQVLSATNKSAVSRAASPLPQPPDVVTRSFSIPSRDRRVMSLPVFKPLETAIVSGMSQDVASPPLTPISLAQIQPSSTSSKSVNR
ncbi:hypothetical protein GOBAR_AA05228 [Gossypium barbadense]|uniref:BAR domain-containing protein n=1 Tax=Gossypium barbadense TaxID=3634 RepID=A0A2P5YIH0_GOSBA|nr:hypothetical protein GOBAR_AA05228 [Gossypium barbadense]